MCCEGYIPSFQATIFALVALGAHPMAQGETTPKPEPEAALNEIRLTVFLTSQFVTHTGITTGEAQSVCESLSNNLREGQGPWGFGLIRDKAKCTLENNDQAKNGTPILNASDPQRWELRVDLNKSNQAVISLSRWIAGAPEKLDASVTIPTSRFLQKLLSNSRISRLVAASILDQAAFLSKLTPNLLNASDKILAQNTDEKSLPKDIPEYKNALIPINVTLLPNSGLFRAALEQKIFPELLKKSNIWVVSSSRGGMAKQLAANLAKAVEQVGLEEQKRDELQKNAENILGRRARREAKAPRPFLQQIETTAEIRAAGMYLGSKNNSFSMNADVLLTQNTFVNVIFGMEQFLAKYDYSTSEQNNVSLVSTLKLTTATIGTGLRWSAASDHTLFLFPQLEMGTLKWKTPSSATLDDFGLADANLTTTMSPGIALICGYQSPEAWYPQWQVRMRVAGVGNENLTSLTSDIATYFPSPFLWGAKRSELFGFAQFRQSSIPRSSTG
jgi:hypothetical protein